MTAAGEGCSVQGLFGGRVYRFKTVPSTNPLALGCREDGAVFVAETQTAGRGRHGRRWDSAPGLGLWFSVALAGDPSGLGFAAALGIRTALAPEATVTVKWPNDLLCAGRKVCGILVEHRDGWNALGIGINVSHAMTDFPEELRGSAGSLASCTGRTWAHEEVLGRVLPALEAGIARLRAGGYDALWREWSAACALVGRNIRRDGIEGRVRAIDRDGALIVAGAGGDHRITAGDILVLEGA